MELITLVPQGPSSPTWQTSIAAGASENILHLFLPLLCTSLCCATPAPQWQGCSHQDDIFCICGLHAASGSEACRAAQPSAANIPPGRPLQAPSCCCYRLLCKAAQRCIWAISTFHSSSRRGTPPDQTWSLSEEGRPTRMSIQARLAIRRGYSSYCVSSKGSTASPDEQTSRSGSNRGPGYYLLHQHDRREPPWLGVHDVTDRDLRDMDVSTMTGHELI